MIYWSVSCDIFTFTSTGHEGGKLGTRGSEIASREAVGGVYSVTTQISYCERGEEKKVVYINGGDEN
jgi:hypothetical protein